MMNIMQGGSKGFLCCIVVIVGGFFLEVESQIGGNPVVSTQYGQIIGNRKLYNGSYLENIEFKILFFHYILIFVQIQLIRSHEIYY